MKNIRQWQRNWSFQTRRAERYVSLILPYLQTGERVIDIGAGSCHVTQLLRTHSLAVTPLDVSNQSAFSEIRPIVYDGRRIPFAGDTFDVALLITVLHHVKNPEDLLREAARVARRIIVVEDVYVGFVQKYATYIMDSACNLEFFGHPHTNKTMDEWRKTFTTEGWHVLQEHTQPFWRFFESGIFHVAR